PTDAITLPDGKHLGFGTSAGSWVVWRYDADGHLDTSFGVGGEAFIDMGTSDDKALRATVQANSDIVLSGLTNADGNWRFALARLNPDGSPDTNFGTDGKLL